jgi:hypothetical protein
MQEGPHFFECVKPLPIMRIEGKHSCKVFPRYRYNDRSSAFQIGTGGLEAVAIRAGMKFFLLVQLRYLSPCLVWIYLTFGGGGLK